jgi:hypothetical protein
VPVPDIARATYGESKRIEASLIARRPRPWSLSACFPTGLFA